MKKVQEELWNKEYKRKTMKLSSPLMMLTNSAL